MPAAPALRPGCRVAGPGSCGNNELAMISAELAAL
jgi:hypothetical protein